MIWLLSFFLSFAHARRTHHHAHHRARPSRYDSMLTKVASCNTPNATKTVLLIKQWHLNPSIVTNGFKGRYPQERNQAAIYEVLADKVRHKKLQLVVTEGCEGEINAQFTGTFNGWDYASLHKISQTRRYPRIVTSAPFKLKARFTDQIKVVCGDDNKQILESKMRLSNLRGWMGFWTHLHETYIDDKGKLYSDAAAETLKVPNTTPKDKLLSLIQERMKEDLDGFNKSISNRDDSVIKALKASEFETAAVVFGGLHTDDLKSKLEAAGFGCDVLKPPGYEDANEKLVESFGDAAKAH